MLTTLKMKIISTSISLTTPRSDTNNRQCPPICLKIFEANLLTQERNGISGISNLLQHRQLEVLFSTNGSKLLQATAWPVVLKSRRKDA